MRIITALLLGVMVFASTATAESSYQQQFAVTLRAMVTDPKVSSFDLQMALNGLVATGSTPDDAFDLLMQVAKTPDVNPAAALKLATLARDIGAGRNESSALWMSRVLRATASGTDALINFVYEAAGPNGMPAQSAGEMRRLAARGDRSGAAEIAFSTLEGRFGGSFVALRR